MIYVNSNFLSAISSPNRFVFGRVEHYSGSALASYLPTDKLQSIQIERTPTMGLFFGYTICQKAKVELIDKDNEVVITKGDKLQIYLGNEYGEVKNPTFYVDTVERDTVKHTVTIEAFDMLNEATKHTVSDLDIRANITLKQYAEEISNYLGMAIKFVDINNPFTDIAYTEAAQPNLSGSETLRSVLGAIAEASGTICYIDNNDNLCFKQLNNYDEEDTLIGIDKADYFTLTVGEPKTLTEIISVTDLGDNVSAKDGEGVAQILRNNPFLANRDDIGGILNTLISCVKGLVFYPYSIKWRGNPCLEIGDYIRLQTDTGIINTYYLGETITYNGGLVATSEWQEEEQKRESANSSTIGKAITETFAKVDKVNKQIDLLASEVTINSSKVAALELTTGSITASVEALEQAKEENSDAIHELTKKVEASITEEQVEIAISKKLEDGVNSVETSTGFTFNENGLRVSKTNSEMETTITEDGMTVYKSGEAVLTANNEGVKAKDLHAETYLIIGKNSRFEDYGTDRTGCFWIG